MDLTGEAGCGSSSCSSISSAASCAGFVSLFFDVACCVQKQNSDRSGASRFARQAPDGRLVQLGLRRGKPRACSLSACAS